MPRKRKYIRPFSRGDGFTNLNYYISDYSNSGFSKKEIEEIIIHASNTMNEDEFMEFLDKFIEVLNPKPLTKEEMKKKEELSKKEVKIYFF